MAVLSPFRTRGVIKYILSLKRPQYIIYIKGDPITSDEFTGMVPAGLIRG